MAIILFAMDVDRVTFFVFELEESSLRSYKFINIHTSENIKMSN